MTTDATLNEVQEGWEDAFYVDSWSDAQALRDPRWSPRGHRRVGPYQTYGEAQASGEARTDATHFKVDKVRVRKGAVVFVT